MTQRPPATGTGGILANRISIIKDRERNNIPDWVEEHLALAPQWRSEAQRETRLTKEIGSKWIRR